MNENLLTDAAREYLEELQQATGETPAALLERALAMYASLQREDVGAAHMIDHPEVMSIAAEVAGRVAEVQVNAPLAQATEDAAGAP